MPSARVTIVIPARNAGPWIEETLGSVVTQTLPHSQLEIILAANGVDVEFGKGVAAVQQVYAEVAGVRVPALTR